MRFVASKMTGLGAVLLVASALSLPAVAQSTHSTTTGTTAGTTAGTTTTGPTTGGKMGAPSAAVSTPASRTATGAASPATPPASSAAQSKLVDINTASEAELDTLPGVGKARAEAIIKNRPYKGKDDLVGRHVIPQNVYNGIKDKVVARQG
jgi:competence protein ComEA